MEIGKKRTKGNYPDHYMETPKDEIDTCLNCPFERPMCESNLCPLQKLKAQKKLKARMEDDT